MFDELPDLDQAQAIDKELNPLGFNPADYPSIYDMLSSREFNSDEVFSIDIKELSKNGTLVADEMQKYLDKKANSSSALKEVLKTPFHYYFYCNQRKKDEKKDHFELGTFAHMAFMEPSMFDRYIIEPDHPLNSNEGITEMIRFYEKANNVPQASLAGTKQAGLKAYLQELKGECRYPRIKREHQDIIDILKQSYNKYGGGIIRRILKGAVAETSFYGNDEATGLPVKIRPDYFNIKENIGVNAIISFKTTSSQRLEKFIYDSAKFQYELSEGMYQEVASNITGRAFNATILIMLQTVPPFLPAVFWWDAEDLQNGKYKYRVALDTVKDCHTKGLFPGYDAAAESGNYGIIEMKQPAWAIKELHPIDVED